MAKSVHGRCYRRGMFRGWVALLGLGALTFSCGERNGDPIVARRMVTETAAAGMPASGTTGADDGGAGTTPNSGGAGDGGAAEPGAGGSPPTSEGPTGLCGPCESSDTCSDANDVCIRHQGKSFCARDCDEGLGCPDGYACVQLENSRLLQCVPTNGCAPVGVEPPSLAQIRDHLLTRLNAELVARGRQPLLASACLDELAQQSALDYASTDEPFAKFVKECDPIWPACECGWSAEAETAVAHYGLDWAAAIERALGTYRDPPDDRFIESFIRFDVTEVGIGFWISGDEAWIALSFH
jgi:hypothetical protein